MGKSFFSGLQFAFRKSNSPVAYCALSIRSGTRDENQKYGGIAHLTEHLLFKGTTYRSANSINSYIEKLGGELNAYTTKEETVIHATVLKEDISKAINLLTEIAFCPKFSQKELEKEKIVVLDEINSYKDSPSDQIYDDFEELLFGGSSLSMPVLGKVASIKKITVQEIEKYHKEHFVSENMSFTVVANLEEKAVEKILLKSLKKYCPLSDGEISEVKIPVRPCLKSDNLFEKSINKRNHQVHSIIGGFAYSYYENKRIALILLVNILGGPAANSRLNLVLREKNALVYNVEASYNQYSDSGMVSIYFGCDKSNYAKCITLIEKELDYFRKNLLSERSLKEAKKQLLGQLAISSDNGEAKCLSMGKSLLVFGQIMEMEEIRSKIEQITSQELQMAASEIFAENKLSKLTYF